MKNIIYNNKDIFINFNDDSLKKEITEQVKEMEIGEYYSEEPFFVYLSDYGLPKIKVNEYCNQITLNTICKEYLYFSVAIKILEKYKNIKIYEVDFNENYFIEKIKRQIELKDRDNINSIEDILNAFRKVKDYYSEEYYYYSKTGNFKKDLSNIPIAYLDIEYFISSFKKLIKNNTYVCIIIDNDKDKDINITSKRCVNSLMDINYDVPFTIKVLTNTDEWEDFNDLYGNYIMPISSTYEGNFVKTLFK